MNEEILLASASPRRRQLIEYLGLPVVAVSVDADETVPPTLAPEDAVVAIAARKAQGAASLPEAAGRIIVAADTVVVLDGEIFGKPRDEEHAREMLRRLSGRAHTVFTGVCVCSPDGRSVTFCERTEVFFFPLSEQKISDYIATGEPMDKAGAYGIQGKGALLVDKIDGNYYNVVGLPVARLALVLEALRASAGEN